MTSGENQKITVLIIFYKKDCGVVHNRCSVMMIGIGDEVLLQKNNWIYDLEYRRRWWSSFPDKQLAFGYREKSVVESILSKSSTWLEPVKIAPQKSRRGYSISKRLVKLTRFRSFLLQLSKHQDIRLLSFVRVASSTLMRCGWVFISARSVENCISVERLNTLNTDLQSLLQNIKKFAAG